MIARGYAECISDEMRRFKQDLDTISSLLQSDPVSARVVSQEVGSYIHTLWGLGAEAQKIFQEKARLERERLKQEQAQRQSETLSHYYDVISNLDSITASFAANELATIKQRISNNGISSIQELTARLQPIISNASIQASDWKEKKQREQSLQAASAQIEEQEEILRAEKFEDQSKAKVILDKLAEIKTRVISGEMPATEVGKQIATVTQETNEALVEENVRREMVKAIYKWFNAHEFD